MIIWSSTANRFDASSPNQGGCFASVLREEGQWFVVWWVKPKGRTPVSSVEKGRAWVERFASGRLEALARLSAAPGSGPSGVGMPYAEPTPEEKARFDAFHASYVPPKRRRKARR